MSLLRIYNYELGLAQTLADSSSGGAFFMRRVILHYRSLFSQQPRNRFDNHWRNMIFFCFFQPSTRVVPYRALEEEEASVTSSRAEMGTPGSNVMLTREFLLIVLLFFLNEHNSSFFSNFLTPSISNPQDV